MAEGKRGGAEAHIVETSCKLNTQISRCQHSLFTYSVAVINCRPYGAACIGNEHAQTQQRSAEHSDNQRDQHNRYSHSVTLRRTACIRCAITWRSFSAAAG